MSPLEFFWVFLKASLFSTGGLGNLPILHQELIPLGWAREPDFVTAIAVGEPQPWADRSVERQPGLPSIRLDRGRPGAAGAQPAPAAHSGGLESYNRHEGLPVVQDFTRGLALGVVGLTVIVSLSLAGSAIVDWGSVLIALTALGMAVSRKVPILLILALAAAAGILMYR